MGVVAGHEGVEHQREPPEARPQAAVGRRDGRDDRRDAALVEVARHRHAGPVEHAAAQLQEVGAPVLGDDAVDGGVAVGAERQEHHLGRLQAVRLPQAGDERRVGQIGLLEH